jgi:hypothetical protein
VVADGEQVTRYWGKNNQVLVANYRDLEFLYIFGDLSSWYVAMVDGNPVSDRVRKPQIPVWILQYFID